MPAAGVDTVSSHGVTWTDARPLDVLAIDGLRVIGTLGFFVPAAILIALVVVAVVRDRRLTAREEAEEARRARRWSGRRSRLLPPRAD